MDLVARAYSSGHHHLGAVRPSRPDRRLHEGSRDGADPNRHPRTTRTYVLRSHIWCAHCGWRLCGRTIKRRWVYYRCPAVEADPVGVLRRIPDHPKSLYVREDYLLDGILDFFAERIFHPDRRQRLASQLQAIAHGATSDLERQRRALSRSIQDLSTQQQRLAATLASEHDEVGKLFAQVHQEFYDLERQREQRRRELAALDERQADADALELLDALPATSGRLAELPEPILRQLFQAFQLKVEYDRHANWATIQVTLRGDDLDGCKQRQPQRSALHQPRQREGARLREPLRSRLFPMRSGYPPAPHALGLPPGTPSAWATPPAARLRPYLTVKDGFRADGGQHHQLDQQARRLGFADLRSCLHALLDDGWSIPQLASHLATTQVAIRCAIAHHQVRQLPRGERLARQRQRAAQQRLAARVVELGFGQARAYLVDRLVTPRVDA